MWRSEWMCSRILYRGNSDFARYDYTRKRAKPIPHTPFATSAKVVEITTHRWGMQHWIMQKHLLAPKEMNKIGVGVAGNSGIPFGAVGLNPPKTEAALINKSYNTQEEDLVRSWILTEMHLAKNDGKTSSIQTYLNKLRTDDGSWAYGLSDLSDTNEETNFNTIQQVNYMNLEASPNLNPKFPLERLYADAYVVRQAHIARKTDRQHHDFKNIVPVTLSFVAGPQADLTTLEKEARSTTRRTLNILAATDKAHFEKCVMWTYYACLHSLAMEGCTIAMLPWISGGLYAGAHIDTYGVDSDGEEVMRIVNEVLDMRAFDKDGKPTTLGHFFLDVSIVAIEYGPKTVPTKILGKKKLTDAPDVSSKKQKQNPMKFMAYNILANAHVDGKLMEDDWLGKIKQNPWNMKKKILYESQPSRRDVVCKTLKQASVLGLTEVTEPMFKDILHQIKEYDGVLIHKNGGFGDNSAILWEKARFEQVGDKVRQALGGTQVFAAQKLKDTLTQRVFAVVVLHLKAGGFSQEKTRLSQLEKALELQKSHFGDLPCVLCGDFNSDSMHHKTKNCYELMDKAKWTNVFPNSTTPTHIHGFIFDYIYLHRMSFANARVLHSEKGSDHYPLMAELSL